MFCYFLVLLTSNVPNLQINHRNHARKWLIQMTSLQFRITLWITTDTVISQYRRIIGRLVFLFTESATNSLRISRKRAVLAHGFVFFSLICKMQVLASCSGLCGVTSRIGFRSRTRRAWESPSHATCSTSLSTTAHTAVEPLDRRWQNTIFVNVTTDLE